MKRSLVAACVIALASIVVFPSGHVSASGGAIIDNGVIQLGINAEGHLNVCCGDPSSGEGVEEVGIRYLPTGAEATAPGCLCEGWGVADVRTSVSGWADEFMGGTFNLDPVTFTSTGSTAVSVVDVPGVFRVTHDYHPSATPNLYEVTVTIENISAVTTEVLYRRVMDWDVEPTAFWEYVTLETGNASELAYTSDDGFAIPDPLSGPSSINFEGEAVDNGPYDHGALFDFDFGELAPGEKKVFRTYYGAAGNETDANAALAAVGAEAYSYGQPDTPQGPTHGTPNTFIFGFAGIGGAPVFCAEDGLSTLDGTPAHGAASKTVHEVVEPTVRGLDHGLAGTVHDRNCDTVVPLEDEVDALVGS